MTETNTDKILKGFREWWLREGHSSRSADSYCSGLRRINREFYYALGCYIIHLRTNNYVPQLYDAIKEVDGLTSAKYAIYDVAHDRLITNDLHMAKSIKHGEHLEHEIELDDETTPFPMDCELSLPIEFC